jgi:hypothetical protein
MIHLRLFSERSSRSVAGLALVAALSACQDAGGDPTAILMSDDAHPAVALAADLPSLPGLAGGTLAGGTVDAQVADAIELWADSWLLSAEEGEARRAQAYERGAGPLGERLGAAGVGAALGRVEAALSGADQLSIAGLPEAVALRLSAAHDEADAARRALEQGALAVSVRATLRAADILRGVGPEGVARTLIARAEGGLGWGGGPADPVAMARAERLVAGARQAAADSEFGIAIQRAYYACQLLGVALQE